MIMMIISHLCNHKITKQTILIDKITSVHKLWSHAMLNRIDREQLRNFLFIIFLMIVIYCATLSFTLNNQYKFLKSQSIVNQFERKVYLYNDINADLDQVILCQKDITNTKIKITSDVILNIECDKSLIELDANLKKLSEIFIIDDQTNQKIVQVLNRNNSQVLDPQSITMIKQILNDLGNRLNTEEKQIDFSHPIKY